MLMENMEKATKENRENWISLSKMGTAGCVMDRLVSGKNYSVCINEELRDLCIFPELLERDLHITGKRFFATHWYYELK